MLKIRVKFGKYGSMKFLGHLDVMRYFQKALRRAQIDMSYSAGFSPHMIMSFASPLGLGLTSDGEYMDIEVQSFPGSAEMKDRLNAVMAEGIDVKSVRVLPEKAKGAMSIVAAADYRITIRDGHEKPEAIFGNLAQTLELFRSQPSVLVTKKTKKSEAEVDLLPMIYELRPDETCDDAIFMRLASGSVQNLKPELVMEALYHSLGLEPAAFDFQIHRYELYAETEEGSKNWIALEDMGEDQ